MDETKLLTETELTHLYEAWRIAHPLTPSRPRLARDWLCILLMLEAGLRVGELCKLQVLDLVSNRAPRERLLLRAEISKSRKDRAIPFSVRIHEMISVMISCHWRSFEDFEGDPAVFAVCLDDHMTVRGVQKMIGRRFHAYIGRHIHPHILRHTFATRTLECSDVRTVQKLLGHSSLYSTSVYLHSSPAKLKNAIDKTFNGSDNG